MTTQLCWNTESGTRKLSNWAKEPRKQIHRAIVASLHAALAANGHVFFSFYPWFWEWQKII